MSWSAAVLKPRTKLLDPYAAYVVSQMRFAADTPLLDDTGRTWSVVNGTPAISSAADTPHGAGSSMYFAGNGAIGTAHDSAFNIYNKDAVVEFWIKNPAGYAGLPPRIIVNKLGWNFNTGSEFLEGSDPVGNSSTGWRIYVYNNLIGTQGIAGGGTGMTGVKDFTNWTHIAWVRKSNNADSRMFVNGVQSAIDVNPVGVGIDQAISLMLGGPITNQAYLTGYIKDFRFTVGSLRGYTSNFTPPARLTQL